MTLQIRKANAGDLGALPELARRTYAEAFGHSFKPSDLSAHIEGALSDRSFERYLAEDTFLLAVREGCLIGFLQIGAAKPNLPTRQAGDVEFRRVYVLANHQNLGVGRRLIETALEQPLATAARSIFLDVWEENFRARKLYERYGFSVIGKRAFRVESGAEIGFDLIMVRRHEL